jgi:hypothetical protein
MSLGEGCRTLMAICSSMDFVKDYMWTPHPMLVFGL